MVKVYCLDMFYGSAITLLTTTKYKKVSELSLILLKLIKSINIKYVDGLETLDQMSPVSSLEYNSDSEA